MKVAILSMQEVKNYGSFLQAFSLKNSIESLGHTCEFINIVPGEPLEEFRQGRFYKWKLLVQRVWGWDFYKRFKTIYTFQIRFSREFLPYLGVKPGVNRNHYDVVVIGSDEVFNCAQKTWFGFSRQLFGEGLNADRVITYAASFGATTTDKLRSFGIEETVSGLLKKLNAISVRDKNSFDTVTALIGKQPELHVDPVLIFDYTRYMPEQVAWKDYMLVYTYPGRITDKKEISAIKGFARSRHLKLLSVGHYFSWCDDVIIPSPFEVLAYFRNASFIVTDTFHGSVFSIKYNKPFATIIRGMNNNKLSYLLQQFSLESRIVKDIAHLPLILETPIDYAPVNSLIKMEKERSMQYLSSLLS